jgi:hypothetical protein
MGEQNGHPSAAANYTATVVVRRIHLAVGEDFVLLGKMVEVGSHLSTEEWVEAPLRTRQSVVLEHSPVAEEAVPIDLVVVVRHKFPALGDSLPQCVRHNFDVMLDGFGWGDWSVPDSLLGAESDCNNGQIDCIDRPDDHNLAEESLKICQQRYNDR